MVLKVAVIGCGIIGQRRAQIIKNDKNSEIIAVSDINKERGDNLATQLHCDYFEDWKKIVKQDELDAIVISTSSDSLAKISYEAARNKKHILCEKPLGRNVEEVELAVNEAQKQNVIFKTGFTLRFHPGIQKMKSMVDDGLIGNPMFMRCRYGITGRPGYEKEWRANKKISAGGELIDQGIHILDLFRWFLGDFSEIHGSLGTLFWNTEVEDNAFVTLKTSSNVMAFFHVSWTQWNNLFSLEIFGTDGYLITEGLGGVYGQETLTLGKKAPPNRWPPEETIFTFDNSEDSWDLEWQDFTLSIKNHREPSGSGYDGLAALKSVFKIYGNHKKN